MRGVRLPEFARCSAVFAGESHGVGQDVIQLAQGFPAEKQPIQLIHSAWTPLKNRLALQRGQIVSSTRLVLSTLGYLFSLVPACSTMPNFTPRSRGQLQGLIDRAVVQVNMEVGPAQLGSGGGGSLRAQHLQGADEGGNERAGSGPAKKPAAGDWKSHIVVVSNFNGACTGERAKFKRRIKGRIQFSILNSQ